jgi:hypothetical protein
MRIGFYEIDRDESFMLVAGHYVSDLAAHVLRSRDWDVLAQRPSLIARFHVARSEGSAATAEEIIAGQVRAHDNNSVASCTEYYDEKAAAIFLLIRALESVSNYLRRLISRRAIEKALNSTL